MIALILGIIGFMTMDGALGASLINAFDWMNTWYWIGAVILGIIAAGLFVVTTVGGTAVGLGANNNKAVAMLSGVGGMVAGGFLGFVILIKSITFIWITYWLMDSIDPTITEFAQLKSKEMFAIGGMFVVTLFGILTKNSISKS